LTQQKCPKIDSCSAWGCTWCVGVHLQIFPVNLHLFLRPGDAGAPAAPTGYGYG